MTNVVMFARKALTRSRLFRYYSVLIFLVFLFGFFGLILYSNDSNSVSYRRLHQQQQQLDAEEASDLVANNNDYAAEQRPANYMDQSPLLLAVEFVPDRRRLGEPGPECQRIVAGEYNNAMGLGNLMFIFAATFGLAKSNAMAFGYVASSDWSGLNFFPNIQVSSYGLATTNYKRFATGDCCQYNRLVQVEIASLECNQIGLVDGYLQSWVYFHPYRDELIRFFTFPDYVKSSVTSKVFNVLRDMNLLNAYVTADKNNWYKNKVITVGVHVRRGDFSYESSRQNGYVPTSPRYLQRAIKTIEKRYGSRTRHVVFFVVCDDSLWCFETLQALLRTGSNVHIFNLPREKCLYLLSITNIVVLTAGGSTFGWWGAYLSNATVYYNKLYAMPNTWLRDQFVETEYFPPGWIPLQLKTKRATPPPSYNNKHLPPQNYMLNQQQGIVPR